ncbi:MAG: ArsR/SmtB family transcription factor [Planctomycetota bacterium]|jgi:DNA-binding transcriptional ArsR family regulator
MATTRRREAELTDEVLERAARVLRVLAHPARLRMVERLLDGEYSVGELAEVVGLPPAAASQHLSNMAAHGIVEGERIDRQVFYRVKNPNAANLIECLRQHGDGRH